jgi:hypothetical protein
MPNLALCFFNDFILRWRTAGGSSSRNEIFLEFLGTNCFVGEAAASLAGYAASMNFSGFGHSLTHSARHCDNAQMLLDKRQMSEP